MNIKKLFAVLAGVSMLATQLIPAGALAATYSAELEGAYNWAHDKGITTMSSIDNANMYGAITRAEQAKMLSVYAMEVLGLKPDTSRACSFTDIASVKGDLHDYIILSCQLGLMGQGITAFRPYDTISRAEFGTALSRLLWGSQYEGGTPYYVNHLNALKAAGIMTNIANAESTKEVRGYVMLMLQRSEGSSEGGSSSASNCDDPMVKVACSMDTDACPAACKTESKDEDTVVKAGDLVVTATANSSRKVVKQWISDLDTLKFKTSEEVTITKVVLERYGRSYWNSFSRVWLEDEDGNVLTTSQDNAVNQTKDKVTLSIKKDYRTLDGILNAVIVVDSSAAAASGSTIGFKVVDVSSTAENVDLGNYTPYEYDIVEYSAGTVTVSANNTEKTYNYVEGESYEVARFKLKAGNSALSVNGFTLYNGSGLSDDEFIDSLAVTFDWKEVKWLKWSFDKSDNLTVSFNSQEIAMNKNATVVVSAKFTEDFDEYGDPDKNSIRYYVKGSDGVNATELKTSARVATLWYVGAGSATLATDYPIYKFNGSKVKLTNNKLGNVDAAQWAEGVLIAEGSITVVEPIHKGTISVKPTFTTATTGNIAGLTLSIAWDEYDASWDWTNYNFTNVEISESGKIQLRLDVQDTPVSGSVAFGSLSFTGFEYENSKTSASPVGSITVSKVTFQPARASMKNDLTKSVQFVKNDWARKVVFEGTYNAKKGNVYLNRFLFHVNPTDAFPSTWDRTLYVFIDGEEVWAVDTVYASGVSKLTVADSLPSEYFDEVLVEAGKSVKVKVEAEIESGLTGDYNYTLYIWWEDENGNTPAGSAYGDLVQFSVVEKGTVTIPTSSSSKNTVLRKAKNQVLASFVVKPSNSNEWLDLENLVLAVETTGGVVVNPDDYTVRVNELDYSDSFEEVGNGTKTGYNYLINEPLPVEWLTVEILLNNELTWVVTGYVYAANVEVANPYALPTAMKTFTNRYQSALVYIASQSNQDSFTKYTLGVSSSDDDYAISNVEFGTGNVNAGWTWCDWKLTLSSQPSEDGDPFEITNATDSQTITCVAYKITWGDLPAAGEQVAIDKTMASEYFKVNLENAGEARRVFAKK